MSAKHDAARNVRVVRTLAMLLVLTLGSLSLMDGRVHPPHGNPLVFALALSWLIAFAMAMTSSVAFKTLSPRFFSHAGWENEGEIYDRCGVGAFRWVPLHSPLGWINPDLHLGGQTDCDRLLREMNAAEGIHWLACLISIAAGIWHLAGDFAVYGYSLLVVNIPFNVFPILLQRWNRGRIFRPLRSRALRTPV